MRLPYNLPEISQKPEDKEFFKQLLDGRDEAILTPEEAKERL
jgi:hypothetical protein